MLVRNWLNQDQYRADQEPFFAFTENSAPRSVFATG